VTTVLGGVVLEDGGATGAPSHASSAIARAVVAIGLDIAPPRRSGFEPAEYRGPVP
jgi:hypothetical protein